MPKYRPLTIEELKPLEKEFVDFLVLNGIAGDDWLKMKDLDPEAASEMTALFSDVVWEGILRNIKYLDFKSSESIKCFQCLPEKIIMVSLDSESLDLTSADFELIKSGEKADQAQVYTASKAYSKAREEELYEMLGWGCERSEGDLFKSLCLLL